MTVQLTPEREAELERFRDQTRNGWRIADDCGMPESEAAKVFEMVLLEMKFSCGNLDRCITVAVYASSWIETGNPFYIDGAVYVCDLEGVAPPPALAEQVSAVARRRFLGETRGGTAKKIRKDNARDYALSLVARFRAAGATADLAASKVAKHLSELPGNAQYTGSTLQKYYSKRWNSLETKLRHNFEKEPSLLARWKSAFDAMPEAGDALRGNRRD